MYAMYSVQEVVLVSKRRDLFISYLAQSKLSFHLIMLYSMLGCRILVLQGDMWEKSIVAQNAVFYSLKHFMSMTRELLEDTS